jgi:hypothetical protein
MHAALIVFTAPSSPAQEDVYNAWYARAHLPDVLAVPGYRRAIRYRASSVKMMGDTPAVPYPYLAVYDLEVPGPDDLQDVSNEHMRRIRDGQMRNTDAIDSESMRALYYRAVSPRQGEPGTVPDAVLMVFTDPASPAEDAAYNEWYDSVHLGDVLAIPGFVAATRYEVTGVNMLDRPWVLPHRYLAIYELRVDGPQALAEAAAELGRRAGSGMDISPALNRSTAAAQFFERVGDAVYARE